MPLIAGDSSASAADQAIQELRGGAGPQRPGVSPYKIPIKVGSTTYGRDTNRGQFDDNINTPSPKVKQKVTSDKVSRFDLTDDGVNAAMGTWYSFDDKDRAGLANRMWYLGLIDDPGNFDKAYDVWKSAVTHAAKFALTGREMDPRDVLDMMGDADSGAGAYKQKQRVTRSIDFANPETAKMWVQEAFQKSMGRKAEDAEVRTLVEALRKQEQGTPRITTDTPTQWDERGQAIDSSSVSTGGMADEDYKAFFERQVADDPEAGAHQAASQLFPALMQMLGGG